MKPDYSSLEDEAEDAGEDDDAEDEDEDVEYTNKGKCKLTNKTNCGKELLNVDGQDAEDKDSQQRRMHANNRDCMHANNRDCMLQQVGSRNEVNDGTIQADGISSYAREAHASTVTNIPPISRVGEDPINTVGGEDGPRTNGQKFDASPRHDDGLQFDASPRDISSKNGAPINLKKTDAHMKGNGVDIPLTAVTK
ncbi:hypothetical protein L2E82_30522 [Cichorium intybus]|uniref:Uncharacterized protein n=1 Tax=Cichorium intybus TaxID=13427 RepID=A0ACB9D0K7_CICIN|nr:hypothetical protein L2E82_30522 [Cichorium intybus]